METPSPPKMSAITFPLPAPAAHDKVALSIAFLHHGLPSSRGAADRMRLTQAKYARDVFRMLESSSR